MARRRNKFPVPDPVLRDAYLTVANRVGMYRETFVAQTENIKAVRRLLGSIPSDVSDDDLRDRIGTCAKNPKAHGGGWNATKSGHGASKGYKSKRKISKELQNHYDSAQYAYVKNTARHRHDGQCVVCGKPAEEFHHCRYDRIHTPELELNDVVPVCKVCHPVLDQLRRKAHK